LAGLFDASEVNVFNLKPETDSNYEKKCFDQIHPRIFDLRITVKVEDIEVMNCCFLFFFRYRNIIKLWEQRTTLIYSSRAFSDIPKFSLNKNKLKAESYITVEELTSF